MPQLPPCANASSSGHRFQHELGLDIRKAATGKCVTTGNFQPIADICGGAKQAIKLEPLESNFMRSRH